MPKNGINKIGKGIYQIKYYWLGMGGVYAFLIVGNERALLIDSAYASSGVRKYVESVTDLPITLVNTHGHFDHIGGNGDFNQAYLSELDWKMVKDQQDVTSLKKMMKHSLEVLHMGFLLKIPKIKQSFDEDCYIGDCEYLPLPSEGYFDLGGRKVSFFETPGHTHGCICLFDEKTRFLFTGDMLFKLQTPGCATPYSTSVEEYLESVKKIKKFYNDNKVKKLVPSHQGSIKPKIMDQIIAMCEGILSGDLEGEFKDMGLAQGKVLKTEGLTFMYNDVWKS